jgi:UDP-2-acetamido-2-deoxy-ribo-hexuluronate aminotransferase
LVAIHQVATFSVSKVCPTAKPQIKQNIAYFRAQFPNAMRKIEMVDLVSQYGRIKTEVDAAVLQVMDQASFINGPAVQDFRKNLESYLGAHVIPCANGTDALQICLMGLGLKPGDEVITPAFTYAATAEVIALLNLVPVFVDVDEHSFNIDPAQIEKAISPKTKAIVPVHIFGQCADMDPIMEIATRHKIFVVEDVAQAIGAEYISAIGVRRKAGTIGHASGTSFFPSKNLGCFGDGGAMITNNENLAQTLKMIANHGQSSLYYHDIVGVNSRLDSIQAAVLNIKLTLLDGYAQSRMRAADYYDRAFAGLSAIRTPTRVSHSTHVFHQYTLTLNGVDRNKLQEHLAAAGVPSKVYYPVPLHLQRAYNLKGYKPGSLPVAEDLSERVISLPMHTELDNEQLDYITNSVIEFSSQKAHI